jgi:hypothetical protein
MKTMKALVKKYPKKGLWLEEVPVPKIGNNDLLVKIIKVPMYRASKLANVSPVRATLSAASAGAAGQDGAISAPMLSASV